MERITKNCFDIGCADRFCIVGIDGNRPIIHAAYFQDRPIDVPWEEENETAFPELVVAIRGFVSGRDVDFDFVPYWELEPELATDFRKKVWKRLMEIPLGRRMTYGALADELGTCPRALGGAVGANRLLILVPCHRVVAKAGLGGFQAGLDRKRFLLAAECGKSVDGI